MNKNVEYSDDELLAMLKCVNCNKPFRHNENVSNKRTHIKIGCKSKPITIPKGAGINNSFISSSSSSAHSSPASPQPISKEYFKEPGTPPIDKLKAFHFVEDLVNTSDDEAIWSQEHTDNISTKSKKRVRLSDTADKTEIIFCSGFIKNIWANFPFQIFSYEPELLYNIKFENGVFHHPICQQNSYKLIDQMDSNVNVECERLEFNTTLTSIFDRSDDAAKQLNYRFLTYEQLKRSNADKISQIDSLKLESLNLKRSHVFLKNQNNDYIRLRNFIATNDIPRICVITTKNR